MGVGMGLGPGKKARSFVFNAVFVGFNTTFQSTNMKTGA
jgi:hypothetical protein